MASYKVIFLGLSVIGLDEETRLIEGLQKRFNLTPEKAESLLQRVPIVVKKGLAKGEAERYVRVFEEIGGRVKVEEEEEPIPTLDIIRGLNLNINLNPGQCPNRQLPLLRSPPNPSRGFLRKEWSSAPNVGSNNPKRMSASSAA